MLGVSEALAVACYSRPCGAVVLLDGQAVAELEMTDVTAYALEPIGNVRAQYASCSVECHVASALVPGEGEEGEAVSFPCVSFDHVVDLFLLACLAGVEAAGEEEVLVPWHAVQACPGHACPFRESCLSPASFPVLAPPHCLYLVCVIETAVDLDFSCRDKIPVEAALVQGPAQAGPARRIALPADHPFQAEISDRMVADSNVWEAQMTMLGHNAACRYYFPVAFSSFC